MSLSNHALSTIHRNSSTSSIGDTVPNDESIVAMATSTAAPAPNRARTTSDFDLSNMPLSRIFVRTPHQWSVHHSLTTSKWIATISRPCTTDPQKPKFVQFAFATEKEARKFCKCYAHPKCCSDVQTCMLCREQPKARHCRNCGASICGRCTTRWGARMVPKTFMNGQPSLRVAVCKSCDWLSNAFCMALLQGRFQDVQQIYQTGNVNLRTSFADIHKEAMFPVHCAVMGGNLACLQWLVDTHLCPISVHREPNSGRPQSLQTSASRTLLDLAMTGRPKVDILVYLIHKGLNINDVKNPLLLPKTLEALLQSGGLPSHRDSIHDLHEIESSPDESVTTMDDLCILCCEKSMDCALVPCGHQVCCADCGKQLKTCPLCKVPCSILRIFRR